MPTLTKRQKQILDFIREYIKKHGISPTFKEIKKHFRLSALSTVHQHIEALIKKEFLVKNDNLSRGLELSAEEKDVVSIPLLGSIAAGEPIEAIQDIETIEVPRGLLSKPTKNYFTLKVKGDSMIDDGILDNDIIIAEKTESAEDGDLVVALNEDNEATLKYFYKEKNKIRLEPRNPVYEPIYLKNVKIQGRFINLIRLNPVQKSYDKSGKTEEREKLEKKYKPILKDRFDYRKKVTYVPNKKIPIFNWFPYKEGFSRDLITGILKEFKIKQNSWILDPFGGCGTTALASQQFGYSSIGIDIMPISVFVSNVKLKTIKDYNIDALEKKIDELVNKKYTEPKTKLPDISIIDKAFPPKTQNELLFFKEEIFKIRDLKIRDFLLFGLLSILVEVSNTSKDGQYLRIVEKKIPAVVDILKIKLEKMLFDLENNSTNEQTTFFDNNIKRTNLGKAEIVLGDARDTKLPSNKFNAIITSPPYLNRYDYSRIYALELCLNFVNNADELKKIRHSLLRSHIEVKASPNNDVKVKALIEILDNLKEKDLNNPRIPIMIKGYFEDMKLVIEEMFRVCKKDAIVALVVGNVRFEGEIIPVDLILTEVAKEAGFKPLEIWITRYKGNSSQQMGKYGRTPVRESIAIWKKL